MEIQKYHGPTNGLTWVGAGARHLCAGAGDKGAAGKGGIELSGWSFQFQSAPQFEKGRNQICICGANAGLRKGGLEYRFFSALTSELLDRFSSARV